MAGTVPPWPQGSPPKERRRATLLRRRHQSLDGDTKDDAPGDLRGGRQREEACHTSYLCGGGRPELLGAKALGPGGRWQAVF